MRPPFLLPFPDRQPDYASGDPEPDGVSAVRTLRYRYQRLPGTRLWRCTNLPDDQVYQADWDTLTYSGELWRDDPEPTAPAPRGPDAGSLGDLFDPAREPLDVFELVRIVTDAAAAHESPDPAHMEVVVRLGGYSGEPWVITDAGVQSGPKGTARYVCLTAHPRRGGEP